VHGTDDVNSALDIFVKDMGLVTDAARARDTVTPLASAAQRLYLAGARAGLGRRDDSTVIELLRRTDRADVDLFARSWAALRAAVAELPDDDFERPSGCTGWLVRDLVYHLVIDAQDVLITLATPVDTEPTRNAVTYWNLSGTSAGDDPFTALTVRVAAAYEEPRLLKFHLDDVGSAAGRVAELADPGARVSTQNQVLTVGDYLSAYVLEWTLHHLDLIANLPDVVGPPADGLSRSRAMLETIAGAAFPASFSDADALLVGTGRRAPGDTERAELGELAAKLPLVLG